MATKDGSDASADSSDVSADSSDVSADSSDVTTAKEAKAERRRQRRRLFLKDMALIIAMVLAVFIGIGLGFGLRLVWTADEKRNIFYLQFPGQIFLNMLKLLILPLVFSSLVSAMATLDKSSSGRLGISAILFYLCTTFTAVVTGIILVLTIHPGSSGDKDKIKRSGKSKDSRPLDALLDLIRSCFPDNPVTMCYSRESTVIQQVKITKTGPDGNITEEYYVDNPVLESSAGMNVLGVIVFAIALGCVLNHMGEKGQPLLRFFESLNDATMILVKLVIWFSPVGIVFLVAAKFVDTDDIGAAAQRLGMYMVTVLVGLVIHSCITLPLIYLIGTRKNPAPFAFNMLKALCTAWGTASSNATLPVTMECLITKNKVNEQIVRFVIPTGATINMDGTALYEAVASIFIAQVNGISLSIADVIIVSLTSTAAAIGAAGIPQAGLVTMVIVLTAVNLPTEDVTLILAIDWLLDRFRTVVNVWGDCIGAGLLDHIFRHRFSKFKRQENLPTDTPSEGDSASTTLTIEKKEGADDVSTGDGVYVKTADGYVNKAFESGGGVTRL